MKMNTLFSILMQVNNEETPLHMGIQDASEFAKKDQGKFKNKKVTLIAI